jgi:hypothetical protein
LASFDAVLIDKKMGGKKWKPCSSFTAHFLSACFPLGSYSPFHNQAALGSGALRLS